MRAVFHVRHELAFSRPVGAQFVGDHNALAAWLACSEVASTGTWPPWCNFASGRSHRAHIRPDQPLSTFLTVDAHTTSIELPNVAAKGLPQKSQFHNVDYARFTRKTGKLCIINL
jgi:hypothetical protein